MSMFCGSVADEGLREIVQRRVGFESELEDEEIFSFCAEEGVPPPGCFSDVCGNAGVIFARVRKSEEKRGGCAENTGVSGSLFVGCFGERVKRVKRSAGFKGRMRQWRDSSTL